MARLGSAFSLTDISAMFSRVGADGRIRVRPMRMLAALPGGRKSDDRGRSSGPPGGPSDHRAAWVRAMLSYSALPFAPALPPCPIDEHDLIDA